jgi:sRNA-binding protein
MLSEQYPRCFFEEPRLRQPLKKNIIADIDPTKFPAGIDFAGAINWYCGHYGYLKCVSVPGVRRLDVDGNAVDTVTQKKAYPVDSGSATCCVLNDRIRPVAGTTIDGQRAFAFAISESVF